MPSRGKVRIGSIAAMGTILAMTGITAVAQTVPQATPTRGALLYANHCIACHSTQIHWREQRLVTDWSSLLVQVRRWQGAAELGWSEADIVDVARHLNASIYRLGPGAERLGKTTATPGFKRS